jgi:hypothetical protein
MNFFSIDGHYSSNDFSEHFTLPTSSIKNPEFITLDELAKINKSIKLQDKKSKPFALKVTNKNEICVTKNQKTICLSDKDFKSVKESTMDISKEIARSRLKLLSPRDKSPRDKSPRLRSPKRRSLRSRLSQSVSPKRKSLRRKSSKLVSSKPVLFKDLLSKRESKITSPSSVSSRSNSTASVLSRSSSPSSVLSRSKLPDSVSTKRILSNSSSSYRRPSTNIVQKNVLPVNNLPNNKVIKQISSNVSSSKRR